VRGHSSSVAADSLSVATDDGGTDAAGMNACLHEQVEFNSLLLLPGWDLKPRCVVTPLVEAVLLQACQAATVGVGVNSTTLEGEQPSSSSSAGVTVPGFVLGEGRMAREALRTHWELPTQVRTPTPPYRTVNPNPNPTVPHCERQPQPHRTAL